jgi:hypothetical protein
MNTPTPHLQTPRFDWMQATVREDAAEVSDVLAGTLGGGLEAGRGLNGYHRSNVVKREGETLARVLYGGPNGWPHVIATGAATDDVVPVVRAAWPDMHEVTRMDSAQDFDQSGGYDKLHAVMLEVAEAAGLSVTEIESTRNGVRSRTTYLGAPSSRIRVRLYEKGKFERQEGREGASEDWFRLEAQIRPTGQNARRNASILDAAEAWGTSRWTRQLAQLAMGLDVEPVTMQARREPDYMRAIRALQAQYGATLQRALEVEGSWDAVGVLLGVKQGG